MDYGWRNRNVINWLQGTSGLHILTYEEQFALYMVVVQRMLYGHSVLCRAGSNGTNLSRAGDNIPVSAACMREDDVREFERKYPFLTETSKVQLQKSSPLFLRQTKAKQNLSTKTWGIRLRLLDWHILAIGFGAPFSRRWYFLQFASL